MSTPQFILELREKIGHAPLWLSGVTAVVQRDNGDILIAERADGRGWAPVTGIIDPGEEPATAAEREVLEETGVVAEAIKLASVTVTHPITYDNGDVTQYIDLCFLLRYVSGDPHPADGENLEVRWVAPDDLPDMRSVHRENITRALEGRAEAFFRRG